VPGSTRTGAQAPPLARLRPESRTGVEPAIGGFADRCLTTWLPRHQYITRAVFHETLPSHSSGTPTACLGADVRLSRRIPCRISLPYGQRVMQSDLRDSNPRITAWKAAALPLGQGRIDYLLNRKNTAIQILFANVSIQSSEPNVGIEPHLSGTNGVHHHDVSSGVAVSRCRHVRVRADRQPECTHHAKTARLPELATGNAPASAPIPTATLSLKRPA
jgi:hypothetical protein